MSFKVYSPQVLNLGDFLNAFPVLSGLSKMAGEPLRLVVPDQFRQFNGFRDFMECQPCIGELVFRNEILNMDEKDYVVTTYSEYEFKDLTERPNRPIETMRHERFIRQNYPSLKWEVDDDFTLITNYIEFPRDTVIIGDRWAQVSDTRRAWNILKDSGLFDNPSRFEFLDYTRPLLENAALILSSSQPFIGTFTGSGMMADLLKKETFCLYDNSMIDPPWNGAPIEYSYWKHFYADRSAWCMSIEDYCLITGENGDC